MPSLYRKSMALCICSLLIGILIGLSIDLRFRPNHIRIWVDDIQELSIAPQEGDIIEWLGHVNNDDHIKITFHGGSPCAGNPTDANPCTIDDIKGLSTFLYDCKSSTVPTYVCNDPGVGPKSTTGGRLQITGFLRNLVELFRSLLFDLRQVFHVSSRQGNQTAQETSRVALTSKNEMNLAKAALQGTKAAVIPPPIRAQISCGDSSATIVTLVDDTHDPIYASVNQVIKWNTSTGGPYSVTASTSTCSETGSPLPGAICHAQTTGTYTAYDSDCKSQTSPTYNIQVAPAQ
jgi:hypothetical protein